MATVIAAAATWFLPRQSALILLGAAAATAVITELFVRRIRPTRYLYLRKTRRLLRRSERRGITGATWMVIGYLAAVILYPRQVAVAALLYNGLGDAAASLVGKRWGRHRTVAGKSWEGTAAGFVVNVGAGLLVGVPVAAAIVGGAIAALVEVLPIRLNDNLTIPIVGGLGLWTAIRLLG